MANRKLASATLFLGAFEAFLYGEQKVGKCHLVFGRVRKIGKSDLPSSFLSARLLVRVEQLGSHRTDFYEI
jgi:hypothetical protein